MSLLKSFGCLAVLLTAPALLHAQRPTDELGWLAGCWELKARASLVHEMWLSPSAGMLLGVSRTVRGDSVIEYELMRIEEKGDTPVFIAHPRHQPAAEFRTTSRTPNSIVFENAAHDFPQRISYRAIGADSLVARIEGTVDGAARAANFPYKRIACQTDRP